MRKRIIAFYDVLLYAIICVPLVVVSAVSFYLLVTKGTSEWIYENWYIVVIFAISFMLPIGGIMLFRYCLIENNLMHFHYFTFATSWEKVNKNIDVLWNQDVLIVEVKDVEIVKLTKEEKKEKVFYKHWFNKYLKITFKYGNPKYVYVGNYHPVQIKKIIKILKKQ